MIEKVYKVVERILTDEMRSFCFTCLSPKVRVIYPPHEWVKPKLKGSKFFAFRTLADAKRFITAFIPNVQAEIWETEAEGVETLSYCLDTWILGELKELKRFWKKRPKYITPEVMFMFTPEGTVACEAIRLKRRLKYGK